MAILFDQAHANNYKQGRNGATPSVVVIHVMQGTFSGTRSWFKNPKAKVSAHYLVGWDGSVLQMVHENNTAYHAKNANQRGIGIELEGYVDRPHNFTKPMLESAASLVRHVCQQFKIPIDRDHIKGHNEIPGNNHTDPGSFFPWSQFMQLCKEAP